MHRRHRPAYGNAASAPHIACQDPAVCCRAPPKTTSRSTCRRRCRIIANGRRTRRFSGLRLPLACAKTMRSSGVTTRVIEASPRSRARRMSCWCASFLHYFKDISVSAAYAQSLFQPRRNCRCRLNGRCSRSQGTKHAPARSISPSGVFEAADGVLHLPSTLSALPSDAAWRYRSPHQLLA